MGKYSITCEVCGKHVEGATRRRRYCSPACRKAAFMARERALADDTANALDRLRAILPQTAREIDALAARYGGRAAADALKLAAVAMAELSHKMPKTD